MGMGCDGAGDECGARTRSGRTWGRDRDGTGQDRDETGKEQIMEGKVLVFMQKSAF